MKDDSGLLVLQRDGARLALAPSRGGAVHEFKWRERDVLRPTPAGAGDDPLDTSCFPMVPYVNRVAHGRFEFAGRQIRLERNWDKDPHPLHGQGWRGSWEVVSHSDTRALLRFEGGANEWPWRYRSEQQFELQPDGLTIGLAVENLSEAPMPAMLGLHPYFADAEHARIEAELPRVWLARCRWRKCPRRPGGTSLRAGLSVKWRSIMVSSGGREPRCCVGPIARSR
jgi:aldose 1-epimerase